MRWFLRLGNKLGSSGTFPSQPLFRCTIKNGESFHIHLCICFKVTNFAWSRINISPSTLVMARKCDVASCLNSSKNSLINSLQFTCLSVLWGACSLPSETTAWVASFPGKRPFSLSPYLGSTMLSISEIVSTAISALTSFIFRSSFRTLLKVILLCDLERIMSPIHLICTLAGIMFHTHSRGTHLIP